MMCEARARVSTRGCCGIRQRWRARAVLRGCTAQSRTMLARPGGGSLTSRGRCSTTWRRTFAGVDVDVAPNPKMGDVAREFLLRPRDLVER